MKMTCDEVLEKIFMEDMASPDVTAHLNSCLQCKAAAEDYGRLLHASLPEQVPAVPSAALDRAICNEAHRVAFISLLKRSVRHSARIAFPMAAAFAICGILFLQDVKQKNAESLALPTQATIAGDWTGAKMDEQIAEINFGMETTIDNLDKTADAVLLAQIEADFARYVQ